MGEQADSIFNTLLETTGGLKDIKKAIKTDDLAAMVRSAAGALRKTLSFPMVICEKKSTEMSNNFRKLGNEYYKNGNHAEAILNFNKALAYAPNNSVEMKWAYGNTSAVLLTILAFQDCQANIKAAMGTGCPKSLRDKLKKRSELAVKMAMIDKMREMMIVDDDMDDYSKIHTKNDVLPCLSKDLCVMDHKVVAANDIKSGTVVAMERAFVSAQEEYNEYTSCYYCHKMCLFFIPCEGCCKALFCSKECREKCLEDYHRIECDIVAYMGTMYRSDVNKMAVRAAIKMSLKLGWDKLRAASLDMGFQRLERSSVREAFDSDSCTSILCFDDRVTVAEDVLVHASLICAGAIHCLERVQGYLPTDRIERELATDALSRIMLHLNTKFLRKIMITCSSFDYENQTYRCGVQRNAGWFSLASKLAHSCSPNMLVVGFNDRVALLALRPVAAGETVTISYVEHFYEMDIPQGMGGQQLMKKRILSEIQFKCDCRACTADWHSRSQTRAVMTSRQQKAYNIFKAALKKDHCSDKMKGICIALDELAELVNTSQHYEAFGEFRRNLNMLQCAKTLNRSFGCVSKYTFLIKNVEIS